MFAKKNEPQKCCNFGDPQETNQKLQKFDIVAQKSPAHSGLNAENGAFLAHLEPKIEGVEVAYCSVATEYTFCAHFTLYPLTGRE